MALDVGAAFLDIEPRLAHNFGSQLVRQVGTPLAVEGKRSGTMFANAIGGGMGLAKKGALALGTATTAAGAALVGFGIKGAASLEQTKIGFTTLLGSAQKAGGFIKDLQAFAAKTPFELPGVEKSAQLLLGVGVQSKNVVPILTDFGNAASAVGTSADGFNNVMLALSQSMASGKINAGDMNQITSAGIPIWSEMGKALGIPQSELRKLSSQGKLMTADVLPKLQAQFRKDYGGAMAAQSKTAAGEFSNLKDSITTGLAVAFTPLLPILEKAIPFATTLTTKAFKLVSRSISGVIGWAQRLAPAARLAMNDFTGYFNNPDAISFDKGIRGALERSASLLGAFAGPGGAVATTWTTIKDYWDPKSTAFDTGIKGMLEKVESRLAGWPATIKNKILGIGKTVVADLGEGIRTGNWKPLGEAIGKAIGSALNNIGSSLQGVGDSLGGAMGKLDWVGIGISVGKQAVGFFAGLAVGLLTFDPMTLLKGLAKHWQLVLGAVITVAFTPAKFIGTIGKVLARIPLAGRLLEWGLLAFKRFSDGAVRMVGTGLRAIGQALARGIRTVFPNFGKATGNFLRAFRAIPTGIGVYAIEAVDAVKRLGTRVFVWLGRTGARAVKAVLGWGPKLGGASRGAISDLWSGMTRRMTAVFSWLGRIGSRVFKAVGNLAHTLHSRGWDVIKGFFTGSTDFWVRVGTWLDGMSNRVFRAVGNLGRTLYTRGTSSIQGMWNGIKSRWTATGGWLAGIGGRIVSAVGSLAKTLWSHGTSLMSGLLGGAVSGLAGTVTGWATSIKNKVVGAIKSLFGIHSPSTVFAGLGGHMMSGLLKGIISGSGAVKNVVSGIFGSPKEFISKRINEMGGLFKAIPGMAGRALQLVPSIANKATGAVKAAFGKLGSFVGGTFHKFSSLFHGGTPGGGAQQWAGLVAQVLAQLGQPAEALGAILRRINFESGGNPNITNWTDSNARAGHPSTGLMQTIPGTFGAYAGPYRSRGINDPLANIYAGVNYAIHRYGSAMAIDPINMPYGYYRGGYSRAGELALVGERGPELVRSSGMQVYSHEQTRRMLMDVHSADGAATGTTKVYAPNIFNQGRTFSDQDYIRAQKKAEFGS